MNVSQNLNVQLTQKLALSHEMLQSLEIIQLPMIELKERIEKEIVENPALEILESRRKKEQIKKVETVEEIFDERDRYYSQVEPKSMGGKGSSSYDDDSKRMFIEGVLSNKEGLHDKLLWQLNLLDLSEKQREIGQTIISLIDPNGFFREDITELFPQDVEMAFDVLETIQTFDPLGIASKDVQEALLYQIESLPEAMVNNYAYRIIRDHFELMLERKDQRLIKELECTLDDIKEAFQFISHFELYPGRAYDNSGDDYIIPDAFVTSTEDGLVVKINNELLPELAVSKYLGKIAQDSKLEKNQNEESRYIKSKVAEAKRFIGMIHHRNDSLFKVILAIVNSQKSFFKNGPKYLSPLTMKNIAEDVGLAESTVSRLASSKYIQTEFGVHKLKYFFTNGIATNAGDAQSSESVREMIREIIEATPNKKISDQRISDILKNRGINIARRTVAKYRNILNILPSSKRSI